MSQIEWNIVLVLHDHNYIAVPRAGKSGFIQDVRIAACEITDHQSALLDCLKDIVDDGSWTVDLINAKCVQAQPSASRPHRLVNPNPPIR